MSELLLGCGHSRARRMSPPGMILASDYWKNLVTVDNNGQCKPDILCDLDTRDEWSPADANKHGADCLDIRQQNEACWARFKESFFTEVHAYEVLEHLGSQGNMRAFFSTFDNIYRVLCPGGYLCATVPSRFGPWLWGDPGHRRAITKESLIFLDQTTYAQCGHTTLSDYRSIYQSDFQIRSCDDDRTTMSFILQAIKPARIEK